LDLLGDMNQSLHNLRTELGRLHHGREGELHPRGQFGRREQPSGPPSDGPPVCGGELESARGVSLMAANSLGPSGTIMAMRS
jgi:hypothetical protein